VTAHFNDGFRGIGARNHIERTAMLSARTFGALLLMFALVQVGNAQGISNVKQYFSDTAVSVKDTPDPAQKRALIDNSLRKMSVALDKVQDSGLVSKEDRAGMDRLRAALQEKRDELAGNNGFERVADSELNGFANYVVQDIEQADQTITISLVAALLILIIVILIA
jgi:hypothetical protein